jgi:hypothetical protein
MSCAPIKEPEGVLTPETKVRNLKDINGWFDYSIERVLPANTEGTIYKIEKMDTNLELVLYCIHFNKFGYVNIKHSDLKVE